MTKKATMLDLGYLEDYIKGINGQTLNLPHQRRTLSPATLKDRCMAQLFEQLCALEIYKPETAVESTVYNIPNSLKSWKLLVNLEFVRDKKGFESPDTGHKKNTRELSNYTESLDITFDKFNIQVNYNPKGDV